MSPQEVEHWMGPGAERLTSPNQTPNSCAMLLGRQSLSDNVQRREGKNPDLQLRSRSDG